MDKPSFIIFLTDDQGYNTYMTGKWHLGLAEGSRPHTHGFDHWYGFMAGCIDYFSHIFYWGANRPGPGVNPTHDLWEDDREIWQNGRYFTEMITERAVRYLRDAAREGRPFFLYVPYNAPHYPMHAPQEYMDRFAHLPWDRRVMAAMLSAVDDGVGEILAEVERLGLADNTCSFFQSDNGPSRETRNWLDGTLDPYYGGTSGGLKGHKGSLFEGGIRLPGIMHWPARIPGGQVLCEPCAGMDIFPTFLTAAGGDTTAYELDGTDVMPHVADGAALPERDIFWELRGQRAVRRGQWKLVLDGHLIEEEPAQEPVHLANVEEDMGEQVNLAEGEPALTAELSAAVNAWYAGIEERWEREFSPERRGTVTHG